MKHFAKLKLKGFLKKGLNIVLRTADNITTGGAVHNAIEDTKENPKGNINYSKLIETIGTVITPLILVYFLGKKFITNEQFEIIMNILF